MNGGELQSDSPSFFVSARRDLQTAAGWDRVNKFVTSKGSHAMQEKVIQFIEEIRPLIQGHGGDVEFVSLEGNTVHLRLHGACHACPHAMMTLKNGIEAEMRERLSPDLTVERVMED
jgi:Fe-S cluster biogenesis protein NfuA